MASFFDIMSASLHIVIELYEKGRLNFLPEY